MAVEFEDALKGIHADYDEVTQVETSDYRSIGNFAIASVVLGILSVGTFLWWPLALIPIAGITVGVMAIRKILHAPDEVGGFELATGGIALSCLFWFSGFAWQSWSFYHSVPAGYEKIEFSELAPDPQTRKISDKIQKLAAEERPVFIEGYMYQSRRATGIEHFNLVRTVENCKFCSKTDNPFDMIDVRMMHGQTVDLRTGAVKVGGILKLDAAAAGTGHLPYSLDADVFR